MTTAAERIAAELTLATRAIQALQRAPQISRSTLDTASGDALLLDGVLNDSVDTTAAVPDLQEGALVTGDAADTAGDSSDEAAADADDVRDAALAAADAALADAEVLLEAVRVELDERLTALGIDLGEAGGRLEDAQDRLADAFSAIDGVRDVATGAATTAGQASEAATAARDASALAVARALEAAGLIAGKGRVWFQPTEPPAGLVHAWTGAVDESPSTRSEQATTLTQLIPNPRVMSTRWWQPASAAGTAVGDGSLRISPTGASTAYVYATPTASIANPSRGRFAIKAGQSHALSLTVTSESPVSIWVRTGVAYYNDAGAGGVATNQLSPMFELTPGQTRRIDLRGTLPAAATTATGSLPLLYVYSTSASGTAATTSVVTTREWQFEIQDKPFTEPPAYFTGATPSDRDADLWVDTTNGANTPKRSSSGTWAPVTDKAAIDAAATAQKAAEAADGKAVAADGKAVAARQKADEAASTAATAKATADTATASAATAKAAADAADKRALDAAGLAGSKGEVIHQVSAPTGSRASATNLWIRSSDGKAHTYDTNQAKWLPVTDKAITDAAAAASQAQADATSAGALAAKAQADATQAINLAKAAQTAADGKPTLRSSTTVPADVQPVGSTVFLVDSKGDILSQYQQTASPTGSTWVPRLVTSEAVAGLDVGKLRALDAVIADAVIKKIAAQSASIQTVDIKNLFVTGTASLSEAVIDRLFAEVVKARTLIATEAFIGKDALLDGAVTARTIAADAFTGKTFTGVSFTGGVFRTASEGKRVELRERNITLFGTNAAAGTMASNATIEAAGDSTVQTDPLTWLVLGGTVKAGVVHPVTRPGTTQTYTSAHLDTARAAFGKVYADDLRDSRPLVSVTSPEGPNLLDLLSDPPKQRAQWDEQALPGGATLSAGSSRTQTQRATTVPSDRRGTARVTSQVYFYRNDTVQVAGELYLVVDGTVLSKTWRIHSHGRAGGQARTGAWEVELAPGTHTIQCGVRADSSSSAFEVWDFDSTITVTY